MSAPDLARLTPVDKLEGDDWRETEALKQLADEAEHFVSQFTWAGNVLQQYAGPTVPGVVGVFLLRLDPATAEVDEWLWVIVGDLPPAYLVTDGAPDAIAALEIYIEEMERWVSAARRGESVDELIPVNVPPSKANAEMLASRLTFLREQAIPEFRKGEL